MASKLLLEKWADYEHNINRPEIEDAVVEAMSQATKFGFLEGDYEWGMMARETTINHLERIVKKKTDGGTLAMLEGYAQENKLNYPYLDWYYDTLLAAAQYDLDSFLLYIERDRRRKDR